MELRHLRYFVAVAEALSFTKAATVLRLAQPSLSRQVRNLEEELGVDLLDRSGNRVILTDAGRLVLAESRRILAMCNQMVTAVHKVKRGEDLHLNIGYVANIHYGLLPATLGAFRKVCPDVALNLFDMTSAEQFQALALRKIDLGFVGPLPPKQNRELVYECVAYDTIMAALPTNHPLRKKTRITLPDLAPYFFIGMSEKTHPGARKWLLDICSSSGFSAKILQEADSDSVAIQFVAAGLGVALMPDQIGELQHEGVTFVSLSPSLQRESFIAWRADNSSQSLRGYIRIVKDISAAHTE